MIKFNKTKRNEVQKMSKTSKSENESKKETEKEVKNENDVVNADENCSNAPEKPNWKKIRAEYVTGESSLAQLAKKYKISESTLRKRSASGKWNDARKKAEEKVTKQVENALNDKKVKQTVKDIDRVCKAAGRLITKINKAIREVDKDVILNRETTTEEETTKIDNKKNNDEEQDEYFSKIKTTIIKNTKIKAETYNTLVDTRKIADIAKALVNVKTVLTGVDDDSADEIGVVEMPCAVIPIPPTEKEVKNEKNMGATDEAGNYDAAR